VRRKWGKTAGVGKARSLPLEWRLYPVQIALLATVIMVFVFKTIKFIKIS
jgi:hypothetical protein